MHKFSIASQWELGIVSFVESVPEKQAIKF